jgi:hypothetical protein
VLDNEPSGGATAYRPAGRSEPAARNANGILAVNEGFCPKADVATSVNIAAVTVSVKFVCFIFLPPHMKAQGVRENAHPHQNIFEEV